MRRRKAGTPIRWPGVKGQHSLVTILRFFFSPWIKTHASTLSKRPECGSSSHSKVSCSLFSSKWRFVILHACRWPQRTRNLVLARFGVVQTRTSHPSGLSHWAAPQRGISPGLGANAPQKTVGSPPVSMSHGALGDALNDRYPALRRKRLVQSRVGSRTGRVLYSNRGRRGDYGGGCGGV